LLVQAVGFHDLYTIVEDRKEDELGDLVAGVNLLRLLAHVHQVKVNLALIVFIDNAGTYDEAPLCGDAALVEGYERVAFWNGDLDSARDEGAAAGLDSEVVAIGNEEVEAC
jgi:hypothetical protein